MSGPSARKRAGAWRRDLVIACLALWPMPGCSAFATSREAGGELRHLWFSNETEDHVTVYLAVADQRPIRLGDVDGFRQRTFDWPLIPPGSNARLMAVPVGTSRTGRASLADLESRAWRSDSEPAEEIRGLRWTLIGTRLFSVPYPPGVR